MTQQVDGNGNWSGIPGWTWNGQKLAYLVGNADKDFKDWFTCQ